MTDKEKQELVKFLKKNLVIKVVGCGFTDQNSRKISLELNGEEIAEAYFDVVQKREYEG